MTTKPPLTLDQRIRRARAARPAPAKKTQPIPPSRRGVVHTAVYLAPDVHRALAQLSLDSDRSRQALMSEAVADLLRKHGR